MMPVSAGAPNGTSALLRYGVPMNAVASDHSPIAPSGVDENIALIEVVAPKAMLDKPAAEGVVGIVQGQEIDDRHEVVPALCPLKAERPPAVDFPTMAYIFPRRSSARSCTPNGRSVRTPPPGAPRRCPRRRAADRHTEHTGQEGCRLPDDLRTMSTSVAT